MPPLIVENLDALRGFVGREFATADWLAVTQDRVQQFAEATDVSGFISTVTVHSWNLHTRPQSPMVF
jgi:hypothetical protein